jgi:uncharacterized protein YcgI (DUF1989 family)
MGDEASVRADGAAGSAAKAPGPDLVRREILIPGGHGAAFAAQAGQLVEIIDLEGEQVADFVAFAERNRTEWLSTTHTRSALLRLTAVVGDRLESNWRHPMFEIIRDDVGRNDIITSMCDDRRYRLDYGVEGHRSCRTNFAEALEPWGIAEWQIPDPFNFFQNAPILPDRTFGNDIPTGKPGDKLVLRTLMDSIVSVSACPQDLNPCNGFHPSPLLVRILDPPAAPSVRAGRHDRRAPAAHRGRIPGSVHRRPDGRGVPRAPPAARALSRPRGLLRGGCTPTAGARGIDRSRHLPCRV